MSQSDDTSQMACLDLVEEKSTFSFFIFSYIREDYLFWNENAYTGIYVPFPDKRCIIFQGKRFVCVYNKTLNRKRTAQLKFLCIFYLQQTSPRVG